MNFIIQKLKSKHTSHKKYVNRAKLINPDYTYKFQLKTTQVLRIIDSGNFVEDFKNGRCPIFPGVDTSIHVKFTK